MSVIAQTKSEIELPAQRQWTGQILGRVTTTLIAATLLLAAAAIVVGLGFALSWYNHPFIGAFTNSNLIVERIQPFAAEGWAGYNAGIRHNDRFLSIASDISIQEPVVLDGIADAANKLNQALSRLTTGENVTVEVFRLSNTNDGVPDCAATNEATCSFKFTVAQIPLVDFLIHFGIPFLLAVILVIIGVIIWVLRRHQLSGRLLTLICGAGALMLMSRFDLITTYQMGLFWSLGVGLLSGSLIHLTITFPSSSIFVRRFPILQAVSILYGLAAFAVCLSMYSNPETFDQIQLWGAGFVLVAALIMLLTLRQRRSQSTSAVLRDQATIVLLSISVSLIPVAFWGLTLLLEFFGRTVNLDLSFLTFSSVFTLPPLMLFPLGMAYAVLQYRMFDSDRIISESLIYSTLGLLLLVGYLLITGAAYYITAGAIRADNPVIIIGTLFIIVVAFTPVRIRLERSIDESFFKQRRAYERRIEQFSRSLTTTVDLQDVVTSLRKQLNQTVAPRYVFVFLRSLSTGEYNAYIDPETGKSQTDIHFEATSPLTKMLAEETSLLYIKFGDALPPELVTERARLAVLNTPVMVRLSSVNRLNGFIGLGPRQDGMPYAYEDLRFIESLAEQASSAFERAQMIIEAQRNETELRVLAQVSTALNIAMDFDTLLEFIYAQVDKVINAPEFYIALRDEQSDDLYYAFYQEEGDRLPEHEGYRWRMGRDLMSEVVRTGQPLKTENYVQEMTRRDTRLHIDNTALRAWMGVPLNAGQAGALGCLAVATTDPTVSYTSDQIRIFSAIADLAATAIYKTRLFQQTEERARQMKVLNDISSKLASEFENLDALLHVITDSAVEILNGEAGSLLLREENTNDLIFQLAVGGAGQELVGSRIPAGSGIAGTVVQTGRHVIVNDTQQDNRWFGEVRSDSVQQRRFASRAILAVPLTTRSGVIGVLEVINKKDGSPFVDDDANLLNAFAGQAAVAIENARLFQMTDQALAERVQQLDNMQRIDQELNRTLDFRRVVDLTIDNAMREAGADSGALALVEVDPEQFNIAGSIGYPEEILTPASTQSISLGILGKVYRTGQPALVSVTEMDTESAALLEGAQSQLAVPLFTGQNVSAVLLLEALRPNAFNMMTASFIQGLAEHANTAITNSRLFSRLEDANQARSQFVGFVAHELKNPMSSIKGYAEVLLGGMTGALNEQQQNFIAVIRRNVVRMQQLVDDLRDLTAQETGNLALKMAPVSFNNVIVETLRPQQRAIDEKEQTIILNVPENLPMVWADELRLIQVMTNFVSNANKYTPSGGTITILAEHAPNRWDPKGAPEVIHCAVTDTGIGMSDEDLKKLFTAYWRSKNPKAQEQPGTGLGMTLTRGLIEAHGGLIWVESIIDVGTTFHMTVPLAPEDEKVRPTGAH